MRKVLVAEDSKAMRTHIASILEDMEPCEVIEAEDGYVALRALQNHTFMLVVTDINMPNINGLELLSFIRQSAAHKEVPVILVSTEDSSRDEKRGLALGANAYVKKPFAPEILRETVQRLLDKTP